MNNFDNGNIQKQCTSFCDVNYGPPLRYPLVTVGSGT